MFTGLEALADPTTDCWRGFYDFFVDNATIADDDDITDLTFFVTQAFDFGLTDCDIRYMNGTGIIPLLNGSDAELFDLWNMMANGTEFVSDDTFCNQGADVKTSVVLGEAAEDLLEQSFVFPFAGGLENLFSFSVIAGNETLSAAQELNFLYTKNEVVDVLRRPILQVTFNTTHHNQTLTDSIAIQNEGFTPTFATTLNFSAFAGTIGSRDAPFDVFDDGNNELCDNNEQPSGTGSSLSFGWEKNSSSIDCHNSVILWDIDLIPDGATILNVSTVLKGKSVNEGIQLQNNQCEFNHIGTFPPLSNDAAKGADARDGENYLTDANCSTKLGLQIEFPFVETVEPAVEFNLGNASGELQARLGQGSSTACTGCTGFDWFALGLDFDQTSRNGTNRQVQVVSGDTGETAILKVRFQSPTNQILDLTAIGRYLDVDLDWTAPRTYGYTNITGYQLNFTSPQGNPPLTVIQNDTGSTTTDALITGLNSAQNYSFRIQAWDDQPLVTELSNTVNVTTISLGNFTIGTIGDTPEFTLNATQADARDIKYIRTDVTDTQTLLEVIHPNSFTLQCDMYFKLALANQTHTGLTTVPEGATEKKATFTFNNQQRDIIEINCFDTATNVSADYLLTQTQFLLLDQFASFRDGTFGTSGMFGAIDLVTLGAVIVAMIGFNRVNETVGAIFLVIVLGVLSYFQIVVWQTFMFGTVAAVLMLVVASTRKR